MDYIQDSGHGWFKVKIDALVKLGIAEQISGYSYWRGDWAYLEEDCDASRYFAALTAAGKPMPKIVDKVARERPSKVRHYKSFVWSIIRERRAAASLGAAAGASPSWTRDHLLVVNVR